MTLYFQINDSNCCISNVSMVTITRHYHSLIAITATFVTIRDGSQREFNKRTCKRRRNHMYYLLCVVYVVCVLCIVCVLCVVCV